METIINWVTEARRPGGRWRTMNGAEDEEQGRRIYESFLAGRTTTLSFRLVKRTAVISDEVVRQYSPGGDLSPAGTYRGGGRWQLHDGTWLEFSPGGSDQEDARRRPEPGGNLRRGR